MKPRKSDIFFAACFVAASAITVVAGLSIWTDENRFEMFWYAIGFIIFLEALLFLQPVFAERAGAKRGGLAAVLLGLNLIYVLASLGLLLIVNLLSGGRGPWVIMATLAWTVGFLFISGLFVKTADVHEKEDNADRVARYLKRNLTSAMQDMIREVRPRLLLSGEAGKSSLSDLAVIEKLSQNMSPNRLGGNAGQLELEIRILMASSSLKNNADLSETAKTIAEIKGRLRAREDMLKSGSGD